VSITLHEWRARARALRIRRSKGKRAPYQPVLLLAVLTLARKRRFNRFTLGELSGSFYRLMELLAPDSRMPDSLQMPYKALIKRGLLEWHTEGADHELQRALRQNAGPREVVGLIDHTALPDAVFNTLVGREGFCSQLIAEVVTAYSDVLQEHGGSAARDLTRLLGLELTAIAETVVADELQNERAVEEMLVGRWKDTPFCADGFPPDLVRRQVPTDANTLDVLAAQPSGGLLVIELKYDNPSDRVVGQLSRYMGWAESTYQPGNPSRVRGVVLTNQVTERLRYAVRGHDRAELWTYDEALQLDRIA